MKTLLSAVTFIRHRRGDYPIAVINFEKKETTIYTQNGIEVIPFTDMGKVEFNGNIPLVVIEN